MALLNKADIDLTGHVAVVTGGGRGLGQAMAQALAVAKASVAVVARNQKQLVETVDLIHQVGGRAVAVPADIADPEAVNKMFETVREQLGPIDILVNNAGVIGVPGPIWDADPVDWRRTMDVNLYGAFLCSAAALREMIERQRGRIINVASAAALGPIANGSAYCTSKAALLRLTECIAEDAKQYGILAFAIDPGSVRTAMTEYLIESEAGRTYIPQYREFILAGHDVPATLSAHLITLLASGQLDALSGRFIRVSDDLDQLLMNTAQIAQDDLYRLRVRTL